MWTSCTNENVFQSGGKKKRLVSTDPLAVYVALMSNGNSTCSSHIQLVWHG